MSSELSDHLKPLCTFFDNLTILTLSEEQNANLSTDISVADLIMAIQSMQDNTSPGLHGCTAEFYKKLAYPYWLRRTNILSTVLAKRRESEIPPDHTGFIQGRHSNSQKLFSAVHSASSEVVISLGAEKAFDRVEILICCPPKMWLFWGIHCLD